ncbi:ATP-binding protein [Pandoraea apista]|uniref:ATP-binding protein n=1 Tax=Pandoraea apista TaxID=93218 RepID=UPI000F67D826|nr:ATP-binding protein [Pandoraea apista]RRW92949.1 ATP-binding protein [Pandoraea apista]RRW97538.1 ATP-binding protein [Pandoraea apista]
MTIFTFNEQQSIGEVRSVETSRITIRVTDGQRLQKARVGRLVAIQATGDEWLIGIVERVWRHPVELPTLEEGEVAAGAAAIEQEENGVAISLVGTYRARDGQRHNTFSRAVFALPEINRPVYPIEERSLEDFMGILSASSKADAATPLKVGTYTLDGKASAYIDGDKLFQRHAALLGSTGSGKSFTVASILEQTAQLPHANVVVLDLHGEYSSMEFASHYRIAGIGDIKAKKDGAIFLPFWLLTYDEMQSVFVDRSGNNAPNQAIALMDSVIELKRSAIDTLGKPELLEGFTVDTPVPYRLADLVSSLDFKNDEAIDTGETYASGPRKGQSKTEKGPMNGQLSRFLVRLKTKMNDRRYAFMYQAPVEYETYEALHDLAKKLLGTGNVKDGINSGIKIIDFSEVPSDILPVVVGLVGRLIYQIQFWSSPGESGDARHPIVIVCDEAHLYLPSGAASTGPLEKRALENYERIAKEGRKYGVGLMVVSQRPSDVSTTILSQCSNIISLRLANKTDQAVVKQLLPESLEGLMEVLPTLDVGEAVVVGDATLLPTRIKMSMPKHKPRSATIPFWTRWATPRADVDLVAAVENMRRQSRT